MSDPKDKIFAAVRQALAGLDSRSPLPEYEPSVCVSEARLKGASPWQSFATNFAAVNGRAMTQLDELSAFLKQNRHRTGYCDPKLKDLVGQALEQAGLSVAYEFGRERHNDYDFAITWASGIVAESGTVILNDYDTSDRLAALCPWVHVAVLEDAALIHRTIPMRSRLLATAQMSFGLLDPRKPPTSKESSSKECMVRGNRFVCGWARRRGWFEAIGRRGTSAYPVRTA